MTPLQWIAGRMADDVASHLPPRASVRGSVTGEGVSIGIILDGHATSLFVSHGQRFDGRQCARNAMATVLRDLTREAFVMASNSRLFGVDETEFALLAGARLALELAGPADGESERTALLAAIDSYISVPHADASEPGELLLTDVVSEPAGLAAVRDAALTGQQDKAA